MAARVLNRIALARPFAMKAALTVRPSRAARVKAGNGWPPRVTLSANAKISAGFSPAAPSSWSSWNSAKARGHWPSGGR